MNFSITQIQTENNETELKNQIKVSFKGIYFSADDKTPVTLKDENGNIRAVSLESYEENNDSVTFTFSGDVSIAFRQTQGDEDSGYLSVTASVPESYEEVLLPYRISQNYTTEALSPEKLILTSKTGIYSFVSHEFADSRISFTKSDPTAQYTVYNPSKKFTFDSVAGTEGTDDSAIKDISTKLRYSLVEKVRSAISSARTDSLSELDITAYVAELASQGRYNQAIDSVPDSFKRGNKRTYISAPFFGSLVSMNRSLAVQSEKFASLVRSNSPDIFTTEGIADYIFREKKSDAVKNLISSVSAMETFTAYQAGGIIRTYTDLYPKDPSLAAPLENSVNLCIDIIQEKCLFENNTLKVLDEESNPLGISESVFIGDSLAKLGKLKGREILVQAGNLIIYSNLYSVDAGIRTISSIYPFIARDNYFLPHTEVLGWYGNTCVWAWTCARSITYTHNPSYTANIFIDFPLSLTHYIIFNGVPNFNGKIEIQSQMFRTDPRFETYNSSGYVYQNASETLFIKSRHKSRMELIRLFFDNTTGFETSADPSKIPELPASS